MAIVVNQAVELYGILKTVREVLADTALDPKHKLWMVKDLRKSIPARAMCGQCGDTYDIVMSLITNHVEGLSNATVPASKPAGVTGSASARAQADEAPILYETPKAELAPKARPKAPKKKPRSKK